MLLLDLKHHLQKHPLASLTRLSKVLETPPEVVEAMLAIWIRKGSVKHLSSENPCKKTCGDCHVESEDFYQWQISS